MRVEQAFSGARGVDSLPFSMGGTQRQAVTLATTGMEFFVGYLGAMNPTRLALVLNTGMAFMPVTFAGEYLDGAKDEIAQLKALAIPAGCTVWLDLEGIGAWNTPAAQLIALIEAWAKDIVAAGYVAGLYVGAPQPLTGKQLYALKGITRYWLGIGRCVGKDGLDAYPDCGWCMRQEWHDNPDLAQYKMNGGMLWPPTSHRTASLAFPMAERTFVDVNGIQRDHRGRVPTWVVL